MNSSLSEKGELIWAHGIPGIVPAKNKACDVVWWILTNIYLFIHERASDFCFI